MRSYHSPDHGIYADRFEQARCTIYARLAFQYGSDRAEEILDGNDRAANADLAKWRALGVDDCKRETEQASLK